MECGRVEDRLYIALELVKGPNLSQLMRMPSERFGQITPDEMVVMAQQTARGLRALHEARIAGQEIRPIHRDLKPANILISTEGQAKITDYGITRFAAGFYRTMGGDDVRGSPLYMAPEQARGEPTSQASDVYSFGLVFLSLLNGEPVFSAASLRDILERVTTGDVGDALERADRRHPELTAALSQALVADPAERLPDGTALWEAIKGVPGPAHGDELLADLAARGKAELEREGAWQTAVDFELSDIHPALTAERNSLLDEEEASQSLKVTTQWESLGPSALQRRTWWLIWALIVVGLLGATAQLVKVVALLAGH